MAPGADPAGIFAHAASVLPLGVWRKPLQQIWFCNVLLPLAGTWWGYIAVAHLRQPPRQRSRVNANNRNRGGTDACIKQIYGVIWHAFRALA